MRSRLASRSSWVVRLKSSAPWRSISVWRICRASAAEVVAGRYITLISISPSRLNRLSAQSTGM
ncbi:hypothetical protein D9M71_554030 [compost metagenome]